MKPTVLSNIHWDKKKPQCDCLGFLETKAIGSSLPIHLFNIVSLVKQIWLKSHRLLLKRSTQKSTQLRTSDNGYHLTHSRWLSQHLRQRGEWTGCHPSQLMSQLFCIYRTALCFSRFTLEWQRLFLTGLCCLRFLTDCVRTRQAYLLPCYFVVLSVLFA